MADVELDMQLNGPLKISLASVDQCEYCCEMDLG